MSKYIIILISYMICVNLLAFIMYGVDKRRAKKDLWRISENMLIGIAYAGGCYGALLGMKVWHHKTRKIKFKVGVSLAIILNILLWILYIIKYNKVL